MTRDEIYEHLAGVYLGKQKKIYRHRKKKFELPSISRTLIILVISSCIFGFSAFLIKRNGFTHNSVIYSLNNRPLRIHYDLREPFPQIYAFSIPVPHINVSRYSNVSFSVRALENNTPGLIKIVIKNKKQEVAFYFLKQVSGRWQKMSIPLKEFSEISDWSNVTDVSFVFEAWNVKKPKGIVLINDLCFSS